MLPALAATAHVGTGVEDYVFAAQADEFGYSQAGLDTYQQQCPVTPAGPRREVGSLQERIDLSLVEEGDLLPFVALARDRQDPLAVEGVGWLAQRHVSEEGVNGRQADVAGADSVASLGLQPLEEPTDKRGVDVLEHQIAGGLDELSCREAQQEAEAVAVAGDGVGARAALGEQVVDEERLEQGRQGGGSHGSTSSLLPMRRSVASRRSSGTASMYQ